MPIAGRGPNLYFEYQPNESRKRALPPRQQHVRRKQRRPVRPLARPPATQGTAEAEEAASPMASASPSTVTRDPATGRATRQPQVSATRAALLARSAEMARLDVAYLRHDLRNIVIIAGLMLVVIVALSFVIH